jgi:methionyl-tRNA formyltransferase
MRLAFLGTPEPAVASLHALVAAGHDVAIVITRPDRRRGRGGVLSASPVKVAAESLGIPVAHRLADLDGRGVERGVVVAYGAMIPVRVLEAVPMLNVHFSLLPRWRGAAPVERAILAGDAETGVCIMSLEEGLDTGPVHLERRVVVDDKTAAQLYGELALVGAAVLVEVLASPNLLAHPRAQVGTVTYAEKLTKESWHVTPTMSRSVVLRTVRLGRAFTLVDGRRLRIDAARPGAALEIAPGSISSHDGVVIIGAADGPVVLDRVQPEGSRPMPASAWWTGARLDASAARWS